MIYFDAERLERRIEHLAMLRSRADDASELFRLLAQLQDNGRQLDGLGPRTDDREDFDFGQGALCEGEATGVARKAQNRSVDLDRVSQPILPNSWSL